MVVSPNQQSFNPSTLIGPVINAGLTLAVEPVVEFGAHVLARGQPFASTPLSMRVPFVHTGVSTSGQDG